MGHEDDDVVQDRCGRHADRYDGLSWLDDEHWSVAITTIGTHDIGMRFETRYCIIPSFDHGMSFLFGLGGCQSNQPHI